jgi:prepilin-type processing-associated H-X9-DG protein
VARGSPFPYVWDASMAASTRCTVASGHPATGGWKFSQHSGGQNVAYVDGHVKWVRTPAGVEQGGIWSRLDASGNPINFWWDNRCPWYFRPIVE